MKEFTYDGFYFLPAKKKGQPEGLKISFFDVDEEEKGQPVGGNENGDMYHVIMFTPGEDGIPVFNDSFEAIFYDPVVYAKNLVDCRLFGCILRKTEKSGKWVESYLARVMNHVIMSKLKLTK